jgi:hypothetical protein
MKHIKTKNPMPSRIGVDIFTIAQAWIVALNLRVSSKAKPAQRALSGNHAPVCGIVIPKHAFQIEEANHGLALSDNAV